MKILTLLVFTATLLVGCRREPDFVKNGVGYFVERRCATSHTETTTEYTIEPGFDYLTGKYTIGKPGLKTVTRTVCDEYVFDTIVAK